MALSLNISNTSVYPDSTSCQLESVWPTARLCVDLLDTATALTP